MQISIIGGGITGLTTGLALRKFGIESTVYEQAESINEIGAGIWLQPNAMKVLEWLELEKAIIEQGQVLNKMEICYPDLRPIKKIKEATVSGADETKTVAIHRGKLQRILFDQFSEVGSIKLGMRYSGHSNQGGKINIDFDHGTLQADILLGADGINSKVRDGMGFASEYRSTNQVCARSIAKINLPEKYRHDGKELWGYKRRFGMSQLFDNMVYFFTVLNKEICPDQITVETLIESFKDFDPLITDIIRASDKMHVAELMDIKRLSSWSKGSACLIGDAAHATTPNMGQGAGQGIEDAFHISKALSEMQGSVEEAFKGFTQKRRKKVDYVVNNSWTFGKMAHHPIGQSVMKGMMKLTPNTLLEKQMKKLYFVEGL